MCLKKYALISLLLLLPLSLAFASLSAEDLHDLTSLKILFYRQQKLKQDLEDRYSRLMLESEALKNSLEQSLSEKKEEWKQKEKDYLDKLQELETLQQDLKEAREYSESLAQQLSKALKSSRKLKNGTLWNNLKWAGVGALTALGTKKAIDLFW